MGRIFKTLLCASLLLVSVCHADETTDEASEAYWEFGAGFGAVRFEQYPASDEFSFLALPAPTFQYRGKILRADDRDGAHVYLFKGKDLSVELSGEGNPALESSNNTARKGMDNLPWMAALGPQLVYRGIENVELSLGVYQAITTDFMMTRAAGNIFDLRAVYKLDFPFTPGGLWEEDGFSTAQFSFALKSATKEFNALYFDVPAQDATATRPEYDADAGFLSYNISYYQSFKSGRMALYVGASVANYEFSANRNSPLHKSDHNIMGLIGMNYTLTESARPAVPRDETSGIINSIRRNRELRDSF